MKAIDTNVLVRFLVNDDPAQADVVRKRFQQAEQQREAFFIPLLVVLETIWVLDSAYGISRQEAIEVLSELLMLPILEFENRTALQGVLSCAPNNPFDLADLLIAEVARLADCQSVLTFDKKAAKGAMFELITAKT